MCPDDPNSGGGDHSRIQKSAFWGSWANQRGPERAAGRESVSLFPPFTHGTGTGAWSCMEGRTVWCSAWNKSVCLPGRRHGTSPTCEGVAETQGARTRLPRRCQTHTQSLIVDLDWIGDGSLFLNHCGGARRLVASNGQQPPSRLHLANGQRMMDDNAPCLANGWCRAP